MKSVLFLAAELHPDRCTAFQRKCCREMVGSYFWRSASTATVVAAVRRLLAERERRRLSVLTQSDRLLIKSRRLLPVFGRNRWRHAGGINVKIWDL